MYGLILSAPGLDASRREALRRLLDAQDLPLAGFTDAPSPLPDAASRAAFLRHASAALMHPGTPLPAEAVMAHLSGDALPGNVLRRYLFLQFSLLPYLRPGRTVAPLTGCFLLGDDLLVAPVSPEDTVDALLPPGTWTEMNGATHAGCLREGRLMAMRGYNEMPVLARENALLPIGVSDRTADHDDADRVTLHWFQPGEKAACTLADGTRYEVYRADQHFDVRTDTDKAFHLIVHEHGEERLIR